MADMVDDDLLGGEDELDDGVYDITNEREEALLQDDEEYSKGRDYDHERKQQSDSDAEEDILNLDLEEDFHDDDKLLYEEEEEQPQKRSSKFTNEAPESAAKPIQQFFNPANKTNSALARKKPPLDRNKQDKTNRNSIQKNWKRPNIRGNVMRNIKHVQPRRNGTVLINPRYEGSVHVADNSARLAWDNLQYSKNNLNSPPPYSNQNVHHVGSHFEPSFVVRNDGINNFSTMYMHQQEQPQQGRMFYEPPSNNYDRPLCFEPPPPMGDDMRIQVMDSQEPYYNRNSAPQFPYAMSDRLQYDQFHNYPVHYPNEPPPPLSQNSSYDYNRSNVFDSSYQYDDRNLFYNRQCHNYNNQVVRQNFSDSSYEENQNWNKYPNYRNENIQRSNFKPQSNNMRKRTIVNATLNKVLTQLQPVPEEKSTNIGFSVERKNQVVVNIETEKKTAQPITMKAEEEDEETKLYRQKIEQQKREREKILRIKEERRKQMAIERQKNEKNVLTPDPIKSIDKPTEPLQMLKKPKVPQQIIRMRKIEPEKISSTPPSPPEIIDSSNNELPNFTFNVSNNLEIPKNESASSNNFMLNRVVVVKNSKTNPTNRIPTNVPKSVSTDKTDHSEIGQGLSSFFNERKVLKKDSDLLNTRLVIVGNLSTSVNKTKLMALSRGIAEIQNIHVDKEERRATILFKSVACAHAFYKKYQRRILDDLSVIEVKLEPVI